MAKLAMKTVFTTAEPQKETPLEKTARVVREINEEETEIRDVKTERLRNARLESEADTLDGASTAPSSTSRK